jgi:hypothetical protein
MRVERTVYRIIKQAYTTEELAVHFSPSPEEIAWAEQHSRTLKLCLLINLKVFQYLGYFPLYADISESIIAHVRSRLATKFSLPITYKDSGDLYRHRQLIRDYMKVLSWGSGLEPQLGKSKNLLRCRRKMFNS